MTETAHDGEVLPIHASPVPVWKVAVIGFSFMSISFTVGLSPAYSVAAAGLGGALAQILGLFAMLCVAVAVSSFARQHVVSGSLMSYVYFVFGKTGRAVIGGFQILGYLAMFASMTAATQVFMVGVLNDLQLASDALSLQMISTACLVAGSCYFTCRGIEASVRLSIVLAAISIPAVFFIVAMALEHSELALAVQFDRANFTVEGVVQGAVSALAFLIAFEGLSTLAAETADPKRSIPRLLYLLLAVTGGCGVIATLLEAPILIAQQAALNSGASPLGILAARGEIEWMRLPGDILMVVTGFAAMIAVCTFAARVFATAAMDGILPSWLAKLDGAKEMPRRAAVAVSVANMVIIGVPMILASTPPVVLGSIFGSAVVTFWIVPYAIICIAALVEALKNPASEIVVVLGATAGFVCMMFLLYQTMDATGGSVLANVPWFVFAVSMPAIAWFLYRSRRTDITDF